MEPPTSPDDTDSTSLRRPMNAFLLFCKRHRSIVKSGHPWLDNRSCTKMLADMWAVLDWDEKSKYLQLARECKMAFMKAHPDYKWCGSNKHNAKGNSPTMRTRTKAQGKHQPKSRVDVCTPDNWSKLQTLSSSKISSGKLADPCDMGGLSLLLLAGEHTMSKAATSTSSHHQEPVTPLSPKSKLFEFAEMCSDQLDLLSQSDKPDDDPATMHTTDYNANITPAKTSLKEEAHTNKPPVEDNQRCRSVESIKTDCHEAWNLNKAENMDSNSVERYEAGQMRREPVTGTTSGMKSEIQETGPVTDKMDTTVLDSSSSDKLADGAVCAVQCSGDDEDMLDVPSGSDGGDWIEDNSSRRTSSRSCKGRLYREYVMEGMLESLQRPERPFNCKKSWKHLDGSSLSDGDDVVFEPSPDKPKRSGRRNVRKRTVSGCGSLPSPTDFDYGEIDVEARLASLPQYSPDQFKPKGRCHRLKKSTCLYKNSTFVKKDGRGSVGHMSRDHSSCSVREPVAGSRKRKAPKSSILHLTLSQSQVPSQVSPSTSATNTRHQRDPDNRTTASQPSISIDYNTSKPLTTHAEEPAVSASETIAFTKPPMTDSHQLPRTTSHVITAASTHHRSVLTVS